MLQAVLGHGQRDRRQVEHLPGLGRDHRRARQRRTAAGTRSRLMDQDLIRVLHPGQGTALMSGLPAGLTTRALPSRLGRRLLIPLAARGLMRIPRALTQPGTQFRILRPQGLNQPGLPSRQLVQLRDLAGKLFIRRGPTHPTSITRSIPGSIRRAVKPKTS